MILDRVLVTVDSHTEGNPTRVVLAGYGPVPGATLLDKRAFLMKNRDELRRLLVHEPRGGDLTCAVLLLEPTDPSADVAAIIMEQDEYPPMCGHCMIGLATTLVELGMVSRSEPECQVSIETPAGMVRASVAWDGRRAGLVRLRNVASYLAVGNLRLIWDDHTIDADVAYGGDYYVCVAAADVGVSIRPANAGQIIAVANRVRDAVKDLTLRHPTRPDLGRVYMVMLYEQLGIHHFRNVVVAPPGAIDRSPCGTGTSALLARLWSDGSIRAGDEFVNEGILGTSFKGRIIEETRLGDMPAIIPEIEGRAYLTGFHRFVLDPRDPFPAGFVMGPATRH